MRTTIEMLAFSGMFIMAMLLVITIFSMWVYIQFYEHGFSNFISEKKYLKPWFLIRCIYVLVFLVGYLACLLLVL